MRLICLVGIFTSDRFLSAHVLTKSMPQKKTKGKRNQKLLTIQTLVCLVELAGGVGPLLVNAKVTVVAGVSRVDALVVLLGLLLDGLDSLGESRWRGWRRFSANRIFRCGRTVASLRWSGCHGLLAWVADTVVCLPGGVDLAVVLLVFLSQGLEAALHGFSGED
jgi:hypothetical protein